MELPKYQWPPLRDLAIGLWQRAWMFLRRAGTIIFMVTVVLWLLLSFPKAGAGREPVRGEHRRPHRQRARGRGRADRLQPRDRAGADPGDGRARGRGRLAGDDLRGRRRGRRGSRRRAGRPSSQARLDPADRARLPRLVRVRAAVPVDHRGRPARDERVEMAVVHVGLPVRAGLHLRGESPIGSAVAARASSERSERENSWPAASTRSS